MSAPAVQPPDLATPPATPARRSIPIRRPLFMFFALLYALISMGRINSTDGRDVYNTGASLLLRHSLAIPPDIGTFIGRGGASYGKYGIGQSLAEIPLIQVDQWAHSLGLFISAPQLFAMTTNAWITAAGIVVLYQLSHDLGYTSRTALAVAVVYGLATPALVYAKLDFSEPLLTLTLLLAALGCLRFKLTGNLRWVLVAGAALGYAVLTKYAAIALVPLFAVYLAVIWQRSETDRSWPRLARAFAAFAVPILVGMATTLAVNWARSGSIWTTGYVSYERPLNQSIPLTINAAAALLISPRYGLIFFATPVLLGAAGFTTFWRRYPMEAWGIVALGAATLLLYATYPTWYAGWTWGPRFLVPLVPFLLLPAAEVLGAGKRSRRVEKLVRWALGLGLSEQILGVLVNYRAAYDLLPWTHPITAHLWEPWQSPLLDHLLLLPASLVANLGVRIPIHDLATALASAALSRFEQFFPFFWFSQFPQPGVALFVGAACAAVPVVLAGLPLARQLAAPSTTPPCDEPMLASVPAPAID